MMRRRRCGCQTIFFFTIGIIVGIVLTSILRLFCTSSRTLRSANIPVVFDLNFSILPKAKQPGKHENDFVVASIITADMFLRTRAENVHKTWAGSFPGEVLFMARENGTFENADINLPVVRLRGVDDTYPPQRKSMTALRYLYDHYVNDREWFIRADDDVYIKGNKLSDFLRSLNSSQPLYIGVPGRGKDFELGNIGLTEEENFCMGGPGIIFSRETIRRIGPNIHLCLKDLRSDHEDVELGRCVRRFARVNCTWAFEMAEIFYKVTQQNTDHVYGQDTFQNDNKAITFHPVKQAENQFSIHNYALNKEVFDYRNHLQNLRLISIYMSKLMRNPEAQSTYWHDMRDMGDRPWIFFDKATVFDPRSLDWYLMKYNTSVTHAAYLNVKNVVMKHENEDRKLYEHLNPGLYHVVAGYYRYHWKKGLEYRVNLELEPRFRYGKYHDEQKQPSYIKRWAFQRFLRPMVRVTSSPIIPRRPRRPPKLKVLDTLYENMTWKYVPKENVSRINFILPISGQVDQFRNFSRTFERTFLKMREKVGLVVLSFPDRVLRQDLTERIVDIVDGMKLRYPPYARYIEVFWINQTFSLSEGYRAGATMFKDQDLLFFVSPDMMFNRNTLHRIRERTVRGESVYFPLLFAEYDRNVTCNRFYECTGNPYDMNEITGYYLKHDYDVASMYKQDYRQTQEKEDFSTLQTNRLIDQALQTNLTVMRAVDDSLLRLYYSDNCRRSKTRVQLESCILKKSELFASPYTLGEVVYNTPWLFNFTITPIQSWVITLDRLNAMTFSIPHLTPNATEPPRVMLTNSLFGTPGESSLDESSIQSILAKAYEQMSGNVSAMQGLGAEDTLGRLKNLLTEPKRYGLNIPSFTPPPQQQQTVQSQNQAPAQVAPGEMSEVMQQAMALLQQQQQQLGGVNPQTEVPTQPTPVLVPAKKVVDPFRMGPKNVKIFKSPEQRLEEEQRQIQNNEVDAGSWNANIGMARADGQIVGEVPGIQQPMSADVQQGNQPLAAGNSQQETGGQPLAQPPVHANQLFAQQMFPDSEQPVAQNLNQPVDQQQLLPVVQQPDDANMVGQQQMGEAMLPEQQEAGVAALPDGNDQPGQGRMPVEQQQQMGGLQSNQGMPVEQQQMLPSLQQQGRGVMPMNQPMSQQPVLPGQQLPNQDLVPGIQQAGESSMPKSETENQQGDETDYNQPTEGLSPGDGELPQVQQFVPTDSVNQVPLPGNLPMVEQQGTLNANRQQSQQGLLTGQQALPLSPVSQNLNLAPESNQGFPSTGQIAQGQIPGAQNQEPGTGVVNAVPGEIVKPQVPNAVPYHVPGALEGVQPPINPDAGVAAVQQVPVQQVAYDPNAITNVAVSTNAVASGIQTPLSVSTAAAPQQPLMNARQAQPAVAAVDGQPGAVTQPAVVETRPGQGAPGVVSEVRPAPAEQYVTTPTTITLTQVSTAAAAQVGIQPAAQPPETAAAVVPPAESAPVPAAQPAESPAAAAPPAGAPKAAAPPAEAAAAPPPAETPAAAAPPPVEAPAAAAAPPAETPAPVAPPAEVPAAAAAPPAAAPAPPAPAAVAPPADVPAAPAAPAAVAPPAEVPAAAVPAPQAPAAAAPPAEASVAAAAPPAAAPAPPAPAAVAPPAEAPAAPAAPPAEAPAAVAPPAEVPAAAVPAPQAPAAAAPPAEAPVAVAVAAPPAEAPAAVPPAEAPAAVPTAEAPAAVAPPADAPAVAVAAPPAQAPAEAAAPAPPAAAEPAKPETAAEAPPAGQPAT